MLLEEVEVDTAGGGDEEMVVGRPASLNRSCC